MKTKPLLTFGLQNNMLIHVDHAPRGDACNCICPHCKAPLRANHGKLKQHYFSHQHGSDCSNAVETALHLAAKQVLIESNHIILPPIKAEVSEKDINGRWHQESQYILKDYKQFTITDTKVEAYKGNIKPDIIVSINGHNLLVEIVVTHFIDDEKLKKITAQKLNTIEIDLSKIPVSANWKEIKEAVLSGRNSLWVYNSKQLSTLNKLQAALKFKINRINQKFTVQQQAKHKIQSQEDINAASEYFNFLIKTQRIKTSDYIKYKLENPNLQVADFPNQHINIDSTYEKHGITWQRAIFLQFIYHKEGTIYGRKVAFEHQILTYFQKHDFKLNQNNHQPLLQIEKAISLFIQELIDSHILIRCGRSLCEFPLYKVIVE